MFLMDFVKGAVSRNLLNSYGGTTAKSSEI